MTLEKRYPCVADMERAACRRIPRFMREYLTGGLGGGASVRRNRRTLDEITLMPRYLSIAGDPQIRTHLFGREYAAPFGVAPLGLSGLVWPDSEKILAAAARAQNVAYTLSTVATASLEEIREIGGENAWFQLYTPRDDDVLEDLLGRCRRAGYENLLLTVDVPFQTRREHDIRNGLSVPPRFDFSTLWQMMTHPTWALKMLRAGVPEFVNIKPYFDGADSGNVGRSISASTDFIKERLGGHITPQRFDRIRSLWPGKLLVKGVLDPDEACIYLSMGADGLVVSNHGGRQLDAALSAIEVLPHVRRAVGDDVPLLADGGVRSGLDIARMLALGADFVLMGRPFLFGVGALDRAGGEHVMKILKEELIATMGQLGAPSLEQLPSFLYNQS